MGTLKREDNGYYFTYPSSIVYGSSYTLTLYGGSSSVVAYYLNSSTVLGTQNVISIVTLGTTSKSWTPLSSYSSATHIRFEATLGQHADTTYISENIAIRHAPTTPSYITVPTTLQQGSSYTVSWGASSDSDGNLSGYQLERSTDNGLTWSNVYTGSSTSATVTIPADASQIAYRVRAYDTTSCYSDYRTSNTISVIANVAPTVPSNLTVPESISGGDTITITWGASSDSNGNLSGYQLERSDDGGVNWYLVYQGTLLTTTDNVAFGTETVTYRVRAFDTLSAYSSYNTSATRTVINNNAPSAPASITVPNTVSGGKSLTVTWGAATDADNNLAGYSLERSVDGGDFAEVYNGSALSYQDSITKGWQNVAYRVRAYDSYDVYSAYTTSATRTVNNNNAPVITCAYASGIDLGTKNSGFSISYSVDDEDGDAITVTEALDGVTKRQFTAVAGQSNSFAVTGDYVMQVLNGSHTLTITASDGTETGTHKLNFSKLVSKATITLSEPMLADGLISVMVMAVSGSIPADGTFKVEVTNNANDATPVWEDCTSAVTKGTNYVFTNETAANGFAFNFRVTAERAEGGSGGYITSVQGGFQ